MVHVRTCPHAKSITIHTSSRSKNAEDLSRMIPAYFVMDGTISITAKVKIGNHTRSRKISYYIRIL
jgi:hypothetical protein